MLPFQDDSRDARWGSPPRPPTGPRPALHTDSDWRGSDNEAAERRVLWIDDDFPPSRGLTRVLGREGFIIDYVQTSRAALAFSAARPYGAIVLDLRLPDIYGLTLLAQLRANGTRAPVVVITGLELDPELEQDALRAGAAAFRIKRRAGDLAELLLAVAGGSMPGTDGCGEASTPDLYDQTSEPDVPDDGHSLGETLIALKRMLRSRYPRSPEDFVSDAAEDALLDFREHPGRFGPWGNTTLASFLFVPARRNLQDLFRSEARRKAREAAFIENQALATRNELAFTVPRSVRMELLCRFFAQISDGLERRALVLWLAGCRATMPLAEVLGLSDRPARVREKEVKRFKDRMTKRIKRQAEADRGKSSVDPT
jgi:CheY-like chemotaxis protein/DNA-directed RNA polymerase specialized sigma24 family protein